MKLLALCILTSWLSVQCAQATMYYAPVWSSGFANDGIIPDADASGWQDTRSINYFPSENWVITDVNVYLKLSGGYNGDLFGYLVHDAGFCVLLNRVGRTDSDPLGYLASGINVILDDQAVAGNVHMYGGGSLTGVWQPDGRTANPAVVTYSSPVTTSLSSFNGLNPNGTWTLYFRDLSGGGESQVLEWGLQITAVPEPVNVALAIFGVITIAGAVIHRIRGRRGHGGPTDSVASHPNAF